MSRTPDVEDQRDRKEPTQSSSTRSESHGDTINVDIAKGRESRAEIIYDRVGTSETKPTSSVSYKTSTPMQVESLRQDSDPRPLPDGWEKRETTRDDPRLHKDMQHASNSPPRCQFKALSWSNSIKTEESGNLQKDRDFDPEVCHDLYIMSEDGDHSVAECIRGDNMVQEINMDFPSAPSKVAMAVM